MTYEGPATLVLEDGELHVTVSLHTRREADGPSSWDGTATSDDFGRLTTAFNAGDLLVRLPSGGEGRAVAANLEGDPTGASLTIQGNGPAPY